MSSLALVLGAAGALITALTGLIKLLHSIRSKSDRQRKADSRGAAESFALEERKQPQFWQSPPFMIGATLFVVGILVALLGPLFINNNPPEVVAGPCPESGECLVRMTGDGKPFTWNIPPGGSAAEFTKECAHSGSYGLHLVYEFTETGNGGWGVHWANFPAKHLDASGHSALTFWIKGDKGGEKVQVGLKDTSQVERYLSVTDYGNVTTSFTQISMQLDKFQGGDSTVNIASLDNVSFGFNASHGPGSICIDDITFR